MEICAGWLDREYENYAYNGITYRCLEPSTNVIMFSRKKNVRLFDEFIKIRLIKNKIYGITAKPGHFDKKNNPGIIYVRSTFQNRRRSNCNHCATKEPGV